MYNDYFIKNEKYINQALDKSKNVFTAKALKRFYVKNLSIANVIQNIDYTSDYYACFILIRSQIEHLIVVFYIWLKFRIDENDLTAKRYYQDYLIQEIIKRINYSKGNNITPSSKIAQLLSLIIDGLKSKGLLEQKHFDKLNQTKNQFDIRQISEFLDKELPKDMTPFLKPKRLKELLEHYNYLSTFIHGGPSADLSFFESEDDKIKSAAIECKDWSSKILTLHQFYIMYFLAHEDEKIKDALNNEIDKDLLDTK
ncbi:MAG: DUF5677 domain-containing protein [Candidatus Theseobacter exili]|nr:DUF5677 domain-containing protein [Candidatus Theseobacter exili]